MSSSKFSYHKLKKLPTTAQEEEHHSEELGGGVDVEDEARGQERVAVARRRRWWVRLGRRRWARPRVRVARVGRMVRRKATAVRSAVRSALRRAVERLREGKPYIGDLFAGNYLFVQVSPSPIKAHRQQRVLVLA